MCYPARCKTCLKTTWAGCGKHVADVKAGVPADQWCPGHEDSDNGHWLRRILGR
jgi:hypothetical protein